MLDGSTPICEDIRRFVFINRKQFEFLSLLLVNYFHTVDEFYYMSSMHALMYESNETICL